ncbi:uncharacterized protein LOC111357607 isoform X2 [Spodoptera litura]|uniref:Uncharacterized protein LOC111357607 isoform X1 n=2 Tax=Spodoptera TaxID=7106 RepID=A0A9J7EBV2_SPOLT|nr:uncharacterized protein LOC111357607 isoform X1 [Spodoptera litura]XP_022828139.1 uncharacterized protein LOC111357607 isoform X2 [Spodoptera litura]
MDVETQVIVIASVFGGACLVLFIMAIVLCAQVSSLRKKVAEMQATGRMRIQKLKMDSDKNHAFHNPALSPDEELSRRGYSMYTSQDDVESGRHERQTGGQFVDRQTPSSMYDDRVSSAQTNFVDELTRELDSRQQRPNNPPPFLLQSIEETKKKTRNLANPVANGRQSETNPNFMY